MSQFFSHMFENTFSSVDLFLYIFQQHLFSYLLDFFFFSFLVLCIVLLSYVGTSGKKIQYVILFFFHSKEEKSLGGRDSSLNSKIYSSYNDHDNDKDSDNYDDDTDKGNIDNDNYMIITIIIIAKDNGNDHKTKGFNQNIAILLPFSEG